MLDNLRVQWVEPGETKGKILSTADAGDDPSAVWTAPTYDDQKQQTILDIFLLISVFYVYRLFYGYYKDP